MTQMTHFEKVVDGFAHIVDSIADGSCDDGKVTSFLRSISDFKRSLNDNERLFYVKIRSIIALYRKCMGAKPGGRIARKAHASIVTLIPELSALAREMEKG